jgi:hypothetical protein
MEYHILGLVSTHLTTEIYSITDYKKKRLLSTSDSIYTKFKVRIQTEVTHKNKNSVQLIIVFDNTAARHTIN